VACGSKGIEGWVLRLLKINGNDGELILRNAKTITTQIAQGKYPAKHTSKQNMQEHHVFFSASSLRIVMNKRSW